MKRKRPETTVYLGHDVLQKLQEYCGQYPHPPSLSAVVREAVEQYVVQKAMEREKLSPGHWVRMTDGYLIGLRAEAVAVPTQAILDALQESERSRIDCLLKRDDH